jgi:hypothetical protein
LQPKPPSGGFFSIAVVNPDSQDQRASLMRLERVARHPTTTHWLGDDLADADFGSVRGEPTIAVELPVVSRPPAPPRLQLRLIGRCSWQR